MEGDIRGSWIRGRELENQRILARWRAKGEQTKTLIKRNAKTTIETPNKRQGLSRGGVAAKARGVD